jgi:hypothetical protein
MAALASFLAWHRFQSMNHPYRLNICQSATLMAIGDSIAQKLEGDSAREAGGVVPAHDFIRLAVLASWAGCINAPFWVWWYRALDVKWPQGKVAGWVLASAALSPPWNAAFFCWTTSLNHAAKDKNGLTPVGLASLQGKLHTRLSEDLIPTVTKSITLWVPFNYLNFSLIPLNYRMLSGGLVALGWNVFLSWQANNGSGAGAIKKL